MTRGKDGVVQTSMTPGGLGRARARFAALAALATLLGVLGLSACDNAPSDDSSSGSEGSQSGTDDSGESGATASQQDVPEGLGEFYSQQLSWSDCEGGQCARLTVPIDYENPRDGSIELAVIRVPAEDADARQGSLLVNPGGPGASGVEYARLGSLVVSPEVAQAYDIVGFDPRGVAESAPIVCFDDDQMDEFLGADPSPDDAAEEEASDQLVEDFVNACEEAAPDLLGHVSTVEAAKDMDVLRAVLGEGELDYLGASYGTFLGATYAELFPDKVGRLVLDGAIAPELSEPELNLGQAEGFEQAARSYVKDCIDGGGCPLGDSVDAGMERMTEFLNDVDANPLPVSGDANTELTEGWALLGIIVAMYDENAWSVLTEALESAFEGDGTTLQFLANLYANRDAEGNYEGNGQQAIYAVNCLDRPAQEDGQTEEEMRAEFEEVAPTFGRYLGGEGACADWPEEATQTLDSYDAAGAAPILVIGTTGDPATPYEWAEILADTLDSGVLLSYDGEGHTAYGRSNSCIDDTVDAYLLDGDVPQDGKDC
ncbi:MAG: alpha/beta hydrolase [Ornithinimicrobium sp.]